jgi:ribosomal protein S18 acetylase RimI-like enzyme
MIVVEKNNDENFTDIRAIAKEVWPIAYGAILSKEQLDYMMEMMYSIESLQLQAKEKKHHFILANENDNTLGFASYEFNYSETKKTKIHKIYILSTQQGKGIGRKLIDYIETEAKKHGQEALFLNVNKQNVALHFYKNLGFTIDHEVIIEIGNGYVMDDYVMQKAV